MNQRAFTLIEVLVATLILAAVALALGSTLSTGMAARRTAVKALERSRPMTVVAKIMRGDIEAAVRPTGVLTGSFLGTQAVNVGDTGPTMRFTTNNALSEVNYTGLDINMRGQMNVALNSSGATARPIRADVVEVEYAMTEGEAATYNFVRRTRYNLTAETVDMTGEQVLLRGVSDVQMHYYDGTEWLDAWDSGAQNNQLPQAVEVEVTLDGGKPIALTFQPHMATVLTSDTGSSTQ
ncbi:MAG: prepilin-type N-terminal cleavage/methylation domain-containing protein [Planctomycetes bacterium]|nr:prepilin-type N-terminal cleavage/methylation domain-containing protein [Planctomycetota bacterium]